MPDAQVKEIEKVIEQEEKTDTNNLKHAIKDLKSAEKAENKSHKLADKAEHALDKTFRKKHDAAKAVNKATHDQQKAETDLSQAQKQTEIKHEHEHQLRSDVQRKQTLVDDLQGRKDQNDQQREARIAQLHTHGPAGSGPNSDSAPNSAISPTHTTASPTAPEETV